MRPKHFLFGKVWKRQTFFYHSLFSSFL